MANMTAADVTYQPVDTSPEGLGRHKRRFFLWFPNGNTAGNNQYPAGGIPLSPPRFGYRQLQSLTVLGRVVGGLARNPVYEWNGSQSAPTLLSFEPEAVPGVDKPLTEQDADVAYADNSQIILVEVRGW